MISLGFAACPDEDTTYFGFSSPMPAPVEDGGNVDGIDLYVYGNVVAVGSEMNGETVNGICASNGCDPADRFSIIGSRGVMNTLLSCMIVALEVVMMTRCQ